MQSYLRPSYSDKTREQFLYFALALDCDFCVLEALAFWWICYKPSSNIQFACIGVEYTKDVLQEAFGPGKHDWTKNNYTWPVLDGQIRLNLSIRVDYPEARFSIALFKSSLKKCVIFIVDEEGVRYLHEDKKLHILKGETIDSLLTAEIQEIVKLALLCLGDFPLDPEPNARIAHQREMRTENKTSVILLIEDGIGIGHLPIESGSK